MDGTERRQILCSPMLEVPQATADAWGLCMLVLKLKMLNSASEG